MYQGKLLAAAAVLTGSLVAQPASAAVGVSDDVVLYWNQIAAQTVTGSPATTTRPIAMVGVAIRDAVNATLGSPNSSYLSLPGTPGGDTRAAASVAARNLLVALNPSQTAAYDAALSASLALVADGQAKTDGMTTGAAVATAMLARRTGDGSAAVVNYTPTGQIGHWAPTPPGNLPGAIPQWGGVATWQIGSQNHFQPPPPPTLDSAEYAAAFNEVKAIGDVNSVIRTADQTAAAQFWATPGAGGVQPWVLTAVDIAKQKGLSTLDAANLFALLEATAADVTIGIFQAKYLYDYWRPVTAIRMADLDGNPLTDKDGAWTSLIVAPNHPSYVSGHSAQSAAITTVLAGVLGDNNSFCITSGATRCWNTFTDAANEAANSRLWGGIHWRFDNEAGQALGRAVGEFALNQHVFTPVPEPATWAMMIAGFALVGAGLRRRVLRVAYA
ncbi:PEPxxWA-CTERM sorting domain-containing protein [Sphingomonas tabacisoli]|uniref:PEPxxWA-CTERM sorting domain-containing protein n=1 Tax=Sphingomonas tabacisoli TaxID=2249466 RepID=A0ABW4I1S8_9SPHN